MNLKLLLKRTRNKGNFHEGGRDNYTSGRMVWPTETHFSCGLVNVTHVFIFIMPIVLNIGVSAHGSNLAISCVYFV